MPPAETVLPAETDAVAPEDIEPPVAQVIVPDDEGQVRTCTALSEPDGTFDPFNGCDL